MSLVVYRTDLGLLSKLKTFMAEYWGWVHTHALSANTALVQLSPVAR